MQQNTLKNNWSKLRKPSLNEKIFIELLRNIVTQGEIAHYDQYFFLQQCFTKLSPADLRPQKTSVSG